MMKAIQPYILFVLLLASFPAFARDEAVPADRAQVTLSFAPLVRQVSPAVVSIYTRHVVTQRVSPFAGDPFFEQFFGGAFGFGGVPRQRVESALGSGVIVEADGLVVTNAHVVEGADKITVSLSDGREFEAEKIVVDEPSDLAVLRIDPQGESLPVAVLEPSEGLEVGDLVLAIGNPFGVGQTVTSGIVSAQARSSMNINDFNFFIQTDAAINPGNSGGPLVAMDGGIVGINTAIYSRSGGSLGIGFAIPSEMVATVIAAAKDGQTGDHGVVRPWLGITVQKMTADIAQSLDFKRPYGVLVAKLHQASPARKAGVKVGDVVLSINGKDIGEPAEMKFRMAMIPLGGQAAFKILRGGREKTVQVSAVAPPDDPPSNRTVLPDGSPLGGVTVANVNPAISAELGTHEEGGVIVVDVPDRSAAARIVAPGDVIAGVNGDTVDTVDRLLKSLRGGGHGQAWQFVLSRDGRQRRVVLR